MKSLRNQNTRKHTPGLSARWFYTLIASLFILLTLVPVIDDVGREYTDTSLNRALVTFGVARGLNGVISVVQGTEVAMEPAGVGVIFAPGQILDPVNDLIERFSWVMLASATSLGIQGLMLSIFSSTSFISITLVVILAAVFIYWWPSASIRWRWRFTYFAILVIILRFMVPLMAVSSEGFYQLFLSAEFEASSRNLLQAKDTLRSLSQEDKDKGTTGIKTEDDISWYSWLQKNFESSLDHLDIDKKVEAFHLAVEDITEHTINLIVIFIIQTILFPLLYLYFIFRGVKLLFFYNVTRKG